MALDRRTFVGVAATGLLAGCIGDSLDSTTGSESADSPPVTGTRTAFLETSLGTIEVDLYGDRAPRTVENFIGLATGSKAWTDPETGETVDGEPFYTDIPIHRVIAGFMIQTGDPTGTGRGGPGYQFDDEFHEELRHDRAGVVSMANAGPDTNGSQFFITLAPTPHLDGNHSVFGHVTEGIDIVEEIGAVETDESDRPLVPVTLESVSVDT